MRAEVALIPAAPLGASVPRSRRCLTPCVHIALLRRIDYTGAMAILVFEHSGRTGVQRLGRTLRDHGHRLRIVRIHEGEPIPVDLDDVDGIVSCGGPQSSNDDALPWLEPQMALMREAHALQLPIVGLCLGSQILARALGGSVGRLEPGPEISWHEVRLTPVGREDPLHAGIAWSSVQPHWHNEEVKELPPGARLLASSDRCKVQAWALNLRTYGFQYHPEIEADTMENFIEDEPDALVRAGISREELRRQTQEHYPAFARLSSRLFEQITLLLMPVDRRFAGLVKDLHH